jgi:hypothetical protein
MSRMMAVTRMPDSDITGLRLISTEKKRAVLAACLEFQATAHRTCHQIAEVLCSMVRVRRAKEFRH